MNLRKDLVLSAKGYDLTKKGESRHRKHKNSPLSVCKGREKRGLTQTLRLQKKQIFLPLIKIMCIFAHKIKTIINQYTIRP